MNRVSNSDPQFRREVHFAVGSYRCLAVLTLILLTCGASIATAQDPRSSSHQEGLRENRPTDVAIVGAKIVVAPGRTIDQGTIVVRSGKIVSVGDQSLPLPKDVQQIDLTGKVIYPGLIDAFTEQEVSTEGIEAGAAYWNANIRPQLSISDQLKSDPEVNQKFREHGITARLVAPGGGILKGSSCVTLTGDESLQASLLKSDVAQHARLTVSRRSRGSGSRPAYPNSPMGAVALARQAMYDADWYAKALKSVAANSTIPRPEANDALAALQPVLSNSQAVVIDASDELYFMRAHRFANEFGITAVVRGSGFEFRRLKAIAATGRPILLPVNFPSAPNVTSFETALNVSLETLMEWDVAPENPGRLASAGVPFAFCSHGLSDRGDFLKNIRIAVQRGLSPDSALEALTTRPAKIFGISNLVGEIARGRLANLVVTDGDLFSEETKILETWVNGKRFEAKPPKPVQPAGEWQLETVSPAGKKLTATLSIKRKGTSLSGNIALPGKANSKPGKKKRGQKQKKSKASKNEKRDAVESSNEIKLLKVGIQDARLSATFDAKKLGADGIAQLTLVFAEDDATEASGHLNWPSGRRVPAVVVLKESEASEDSATEDSATGTGKSKKTKQEDPKGTTDEKAEDENEAGPVDRAASFDVNFPLGSFGVNSTPDVESVLITNVTVWTCAEAGIIENGSILFQGGKIVAVGRDVPLPDSKTTIVIDGKGMHVTPGIIDCHSHMASDGGINESGQAITAEVRIGDFINANDINIYRQLAGGVTSSNILHGSANPIGGQNQVIKLRWGMLDEELKFAEAPAGIKFALGENVKRSRSPDSTRYPRTRMGVEQIFMDEFRAAKGYEQEWKKWNKTRQGLPPRRNLELDAIVEILNRERWIHCHSYRQDEILALIRLLDGFNIQIGTFQHILEGYKVADAMKEHGAMGSAFADWWAYKFEVYDAIPYAGALMHNAGVVVSFNSDDRELARHLNHEAAKAVKYGGVPPEEAMKFVTLNPARQLRIDQYVGSLEVGKHADIVLWSGDPLSTVSRCEKTWVDGRRFFDREADLKSRSRFADMKRQLVQKVLRSGEKMNDLPRGRVPKESEMWPSYDEFCKCKNAAQNR